MLLNFTFDDNIRRTKRGCPRSLRTGPRARPSPWTCGGTTGAALHSRPRTALLSRFGLGCYQEVRQWLLEQNLPLMVAAAGLMAVQVSSVRYPPLYQTVKVGSILLTLCTCSQLDKRVYGHFV